MKLILLLFTVMTTFTSIIAQDDPWTTYMTPADEHKILASYSGEFEFDITMWMEVGHEPMKVKAKSTNKMILGERFLVMEQSGDMMGMDYQAISTLGFNTISKDFTLTTLTNMGTGTLTLNGKWIETGKTIDLNGQLVNPVDKSIINVRQKITFIDKDNLLIENFDQSGNEAEIKSIKYKLTRKNK